MTKRSAWPMRIDAGTTRVGTATIRDDSRPAMTTAQRRIYERTGVPPQTAALDDPLDPFARAPLGRDSEAVVTLPRQQGKYRNTKCEHEGVKFDSQKERSRWFHLIQLQAAREICDLQLQVAYVLIERRQRDDGTWEKATKYVADFVYTDVATGKTVVEDVKSPATRKNPTYVLKRKLMLDRHGITIKEL
ncbi:DUF1064 domain-containing protein [Burkholderia gladioli]|uniref:DUF1064 domain-containing protein n=1 Tax=Burkholderia gladioli TaxID=28095 RepID=UPI001FC8DE3F|nr:DUF1064 domain-containing protein [Burkholderia gladioli]